MLYKVVLREELTRFLKRERADVFVPRGTVVEDFEGKVPVGKGADRPQPAVRVRFGLVQY
jgi:hypothetical protein